jgi:hypothetical protein
LFRDEDLLYVKEFLFDFDFLEDIRLSDAFIKIFELALNKRPSQSKTEDLEKIKTFTFTIFD